MGIKFLAIILMISLCGCASVTPKIFPFLEREQILNIFEKDYKILLLAMEKTNVDIFNGARLLNNYLIIDKTPTFEEFKIYIYRYSSCSEWIINKWWDEVMINYNLLNKIEDKK